MGNDALDAETDMGTGARDSGPDATDGGTKADSPPPGDAGDSGDTSKNGA